MEGLRASDLRRVLDFLHVLYSIHDAGEFRERLLWALHSAFPADSISLTDVDLRTHQVTGTIAPDIPMDRTKFTQHATDHPVIAHYEQTGDGHALKISDFLTRRQFHRLGLYSEFYRWVGTEYQLAATLPAPAGRVTGLAVNRTLRDFSERERRMLNLLRPHVIQAYQTASLMTQLRHDAARGAEASGPAYGLISVTRDGRVLSMTPEAQTVLAQYYGDIVQPGRRLPEDLDAWFTHHEAPQGRVDEVPQARLPLIRGHQGRGLVVRRVVDGEQIHLVVELRGRTIPPTSLERLGLTRREAEVMALVLQNYTNKTIATRLGMDQRTVAKHLEHVYNKFGVTTRGAAATWTLQGIRLVEGAHG
ncbi:MAG TPA: helix-turn-helix transcriptional regulator [bacterium]|nr:helix-turn-helix transcriptional regulator [bacterium]